MQDVPNKRTETCEQRPAGMRAAVRRAFDRAGASVTLPAMGPGRATQRLWDALGLDGQPLDDCACAAR